MTLTIDVKKCARCSMDHPGLEFAALTRPMVIEIGGEAVSYQWWSTCPANWEPILLNVELGSIQVLSKT